MADTGVVRVSGAFSGGLPGEVELLLTGGALRAIVHEWTYTVVDLSTNSTTVSAAPAIIGNIWVNTVLSAHACPILDGATTIWSLPASTPVTTTDATSFKHLHGTRCETSLIVDPNDAATGAIVVQWRLI
jgi:hypothetical protein